MLILASYVLSMFKIDHEPLHTHICAFEYFWTKERNKISAKCRNTIKEATVRSFNFKMKKELDQSPLTKVVDN